MPKHTHFRHIAAVLQYTPFLHPRFPRIATRIGCHGDGFECVASAAHPCQHTPKPVRNDINGAAKVVTSAKGNKKELQPKKGIPAYNRYQSVYL